MLKSLPPLKCPSAEAVGSHAILRQTAHLPAEYVMTDSVRRKPPSRKTRRKLPLRSRLSPPTLTGEITTPLTPSKTRDNVAHAGPSPPQPSLRELTPSRPRARSSSPFPSRCSSTASMDSTITATFLSLCPVALDATVEITMPHSNGLKTPLQASSRKKTTATPRSLPLTVASTRPSPRPRSRLLTTLTSPLTTLPL